LKILLHVMHDALVAKIWRRLSIHFDPVVILGSGQSVLTRCYFK